MDTDQVKAKAICVFRHAERILVAHSTDRVKSQRYARPLGGTVEFGERAADALRREIREELGLELRDPCLLGVLENLFVLDGKPGHEIIFVFDAAFVEARSYDAPTLPLAEPGWDGPAEWATIDSFRAGAVPLYPDGLLALLDRCSPTSRDTPP